MYSLPVCLILTQPKDLNVKVVVAFLTNKNNQLKIMNVLLVMQSFKFYFIF